MNGRAASWAIRRRACQWLLAAAALAGCGASSVPAASRSLTTLGHFHSPALGVTREYFIYLPPAYSTDSRARFPVVYLLHGYAGDEAEWLTHGDISLVADSLIASGAPPFILVMPDGDRGYWVNWEESRTFEECAASDELGEPAASGCARRWRYGDYIAHDLIAHIDSTYRTVPDRAGRGVMGLSMGGTGALLLAFTNPRLFGAAASLSAVAIPLATTDGPCGTAITSPRTFDAFEQGMGRPSPKWRQLWGTDTTAWWRHDPLRAAEHLFKSGEVRPALRMEVGRFDPLAGGNCALDSSLTRLGFEHEFLIWGGAHDWQAWREHEGATLAWMVSQLSGRRNQPAAIEGQ
ncbi:MAG TPA: alpha/beta hydrolase-fold protein [Gemmatimonadales bacterium]|nr:alpha/beta hydrolase-fold protein [Gemmatimonadales bacterium]